MPNMITGGTNERTDEIGSSNVVIMLLVGCGYRLYVYRWCGLSFLPSCRSHMGKNPVGYHFRIECLPLFIC